MARKSRKEITRAPTSCPITYGGIDIPSESSGDQDRECDECSPHQYVHNTTPDSCSIVESVVDCLLRVSEPAPSPRSLQSQTVANIPLHREPGSDPLRE